MSKWKMFWKSYHTTIAGVVAGGFGYAASNHTWEQAVVWTAVGLVGVLAKAYHVQ